MDAINSKNERIKREYYRYQIQAKQKSEVTMKSVYKALSRFEQYINFKDFSTFNKEQAISFKKHLSKLNTVRTKEPLSKSTVLSTLISLKEFFFWLAWQPGYKSKIHVPDIEYFNLSEKEISIAKAGTLKDYPTLAQVRKVIFSMPIDTLIQRRNRALIAFTILTGMRDSAIASLKLKHINLFQNPILVSQSPDEVKTKFSKQIYSHFLPVGDDLKEVVVSWINELSEVLNFGINDPVFPKTQVISNESHIFETNGLGRVCWSDASPIRAIFKKAFTDCGLPYFSPHRFRDTLVQYGQEICNTPEDFKAWSQTLGHSSPLTTFISYGQIDPHRQGRIISELKENKSNKMSKKQIQDLMNNLIREL